MTKDIYKQTRIELNVGLDENHVPIAMDWNASDGGGEGKCKAVMLAMWEADEANTMRIDLWDKEMSVYDMQRFFHQTLTTMADTYDRATGQKEIGKLMRNFAANFGRETGILS